MGVYTCRINPVGVFQPVVFFNYCVLKYIAVSRIITRFKTLFVDSAEVGF